MAGASKVRSRPDEGGDVAGKRTYPELADLLRPIHLWHWSVGFCERWFFSRSYGLLVLAMPFLAAVVGGGALVLWLRDAPMDEVVAATEARLRQAIDEDDQEAQDVYLRTLVSLRPTQSEYRMRLGLFHLENDRKAQGVAAISSLIPDNRAGYIPARMWLVEQSLQENPVLPMSDDQREAQLQTIVKYSPDTLPAWIRLSELYFRNRDWYMAESSLEEARKRDPIHSLDLARIRRMLGREPDTYLPLAAEAEEALADQLAEDRRNDRVRIAVAEALAIQGREEQAADVLRTGLNLGDSKELRQATANLLISRTKTALDRKTANNGSIAELMEALRLDPMNQDGLVLLSRLVGIGLRPQAEVFEVLTERWKASAAESPDDKMSRLVLAGLCEDAWKVTQQKAYAVESIAYYETLVPDNPDVGIRIARLMNETGDADGGRAVAESILSETERSLAQQPEGDELVRLWIRRCRAEILLGRSEDVVAQLQADESSALMSESPALQEIFGKACLAEAERLQSSEDGEDEARLIPLLKAAAGIRATQLPALQAMAILGASDRSISDAAEKQLRELMVEGQAEAELFNVVGGLALVRQDNSMARQFLELAYVRDSDNPIILNNLAVALVRSESPDFSKALRMADSALTEWDRVNPDGKNKENILLTRAEVLVAMRSWEQALPDLVEVIRRKPGNALAHELISSTYQGLGDAVQAQLHSERAAALRATADSGS